MVAEIIANDAIDIGGQVYIKREALLRYLAGSDVTFGTLKWYGSSENTDA